MAVRDDGACYPTETIILKKGRKHYRVPVRSQHWQLRSLISAEKRHLIYFPGGRRNNHVLCLNTQTRKCEPVRLLTFSPRCLVAKGNWLCCGSERGEFMAMRLEEDGINDADFDFGLEGRPFSLFTPPSQASILSLVARARRTNTSLVAKNAMLAKERINCITLWTPPAHLAPSDGAYPFPVAVLANNDRTVVLVNLEEAEDNDDIDPLDTISYPDFVNRAIISPDGRLLIAILDDPYLYVHERVNNSGQSGPDSGTERDWCWEEKQVLMLKSQKKDDRSDSRGSFAACFSSSGAYLAVGTQHGTVSVFNTDLLTDPDADPLMTTFESSRPESGPGAIRDMAFCPGPFDILAWTEDRGHIGLADVRSNFQVRQIVDINAEAGFEHIDIPGRSTVDTRHRDRRNEGERREASTPSSALGSNLNLGEDRRRTTERLDALNHPLTTDEMMVLEAIRGDRRRRDRASQRGEGEGDDSAPAPRPPRGASGLLRLQAEGDGGGSQDRGTSATATTATGRMIGELLGDYRDQRDRAHERAHNARQLLLDASERPTPPRRPDQQWTERSGERGSGTRGQRDRDSTYMGVFDILQARERGSGGGIEVDDDDDDDDDDDMSLLTPLVRQVVTRWEESAIRGTLVQDHAVFEVEPSPDNTSGLAWGEDGRTLFVGAQNGIYEFHVDVQSWKLSPRIQPR